MTRHGPISPSRTGGFTLIEVVFVIVVIGLLIGGLLKGGEMVSSGQTKATATNWRNVSAAVNTFTQKYAAHNG